MAAQLTCMAPLCPGPARTPDPEQAPRSNVAESREAAPAGHAPVTRPLSPGDSTTEPMVMGIKPNRSLMPRLAEKGHGLCPWLLGSWSHWENPRVIHSGGWHGGPTASIGQNSVLRCHVSVHTGYREKAKKTPAT